MGGLPGPLAKFCLLDMACKSPSQPMLQVVNDLLDPRRGNLKLREDPKRGFFIEGIKEETLVSAEHALSIIAAGDAHRKVPCCLPACWPCPHLPETLPRQGACLHLSGHAQSWLWPTLTSALASVSPCCCARAHQPQRASMSFRPLTAKTCLTLQLQQTSS